MATPNQTRNSRITTTSLRSLAPADKDWFIRDTAQRGFQIKVPPTGKAIYQVEARLGGTGRVKKFKLANVQDITLDEARERAKQALDKIRSGIDPLQEKRAQTHEGKTLQQLIDLYITSKNLKPRTKKDYKQIAERRFGHWPNMRVRDITKHEIRDWYAKGRTTPTQTEQAYRFLNALMVFALGLEIITNNPCELVTNAGLRYTIKKRTKHIEVNEDLARFLNIFSRYKYQRDSERVARDIILLILTTGLRSTEASTLQWKDVDMRRKLFIVRDTKNGSDHTVPMISMTYSMFQYRQEHSEGSPYVFRIKGDKKSPYITSFQKTLKNICDDAAVPVVTAHDLRRTFATVLNSLGVGYADLKQLLNHKTADITADVYIQPDVEHLRQIIYQVGDFYDRKIPYFPAGQGCSRYASGVLRLCFYGKGEVTPEELPDPREEDQDWIDHNEANLWE